MSSTTSRSKPYSTSAINDFVATRHHDTYAFIDPKHSDLSGRSVFITGASRGIGLTTSLSFAAAGCTQIAVAARSDLSETTEKIKAAAKKAGRSEPQVIALQLDVTSEESVAAAAEAVSKAFGSLDFLINNAGFLSEWKIIGEGEPTDWWRSWEVNLKGIYLCTHYFLPLVLGSSLRTIVNITSVGAHLTWPGSSAYQMSKFATCRFTEYLDAEYHNKGLVVIGAHPGGVLTELSSGMPEALHSTYLNDSPELAGDTLAWLGRERREWLSGRYIDVGWDMEELSKKEREVVDRDLLKFRMTT